MGDLLWLRIRCAVETSSNKPHCAAYIWLEPISRKGVLFCTRALPLALRHAVIISFLAFVGVGERGVPLSLKVEHSGVFLSKEPLLCFTLSRVRFAVSLRDQCSYWILRAWPCCSINQLLSEWMDQNVAFMPVISQAWSHHRFYKITTTKVDVNFNYFNFFFFASADATSSCKLPSGEAGIIWDSICFAFLLLQRRVFMSYYFLHVVADIKASQILASR